MHNLHLLLQSEVQEYIRLHRNDDARILALRQSPFDGLSMSSIVQQVYGYQKSRTRFPTWCNTPGVLFPRQVSLEQASSEVTAQFKASIASGHSFIDLSSGFGVDSFYFARRFDSGISIDRDPELLEIQKHNHQLLGCTNLRYVSQSADDFLHSYNAHADWIYVDPSRRKGSRRVVSLSECKPDVPSLLTALFRISPRMMIKTSPLLDINLGIMELRNVKQVFIVEHDGDCRELLFVAERGYTAPPEIEAVVLEPAGKHFTFRFTRKEEETSSVRYSDPLAWLYIPSPAMMKAGAFKLIASRFNLQKLSAHTHVYTSDQLRPDFPGRILRPIASTQATPGAIKEFFPSGMALALSKNHPLSAESLLKKCRLKAGGDRYLLAFRGVKKKFVYVAERLLT